MQTTVTEQVYFDASAVLQTSAHLTIAGGPLDRATFGCACVRVPIAYNLMRGIGSALTAVAEYAIQQVFPPTTRSGLPERRGETWIESVVPYEGPDPRTPLLLVGIRRRKIVPTNWVSLTFAEWFGNVVQQGVLVTVDGGVEPWREMYTKVPPFTSVDSRYLVIVEPAGTHGRRIANLIARYKETGTPLGVVVLCAIVTPDFCVHVSAQHPDARIFALRYDMALDMGGFPVPGFSGAQHRLDVDPDLLREP